MNNNDILRRVRYALDISDINMSKIFKFGGLDLDVDAVKNILKKEIDDGYVSLNNADLKKFLDGFIIFKRGKLEEKPGQEQQDDEFGKGKNSNNNNLILKKLRIALSYKSNDMVKVFKLGGVEISESELSALFRKKDHKNYRECGDKYIRVFLKGLVELHRGDRD